ncbi:ethylbenzene dehydrogenase-related protein [Halomonas sp. BC04]|uniref:ethylbenzene dehydrogenase-related protein n=1 Tax=Halomonas sp. BC04 TaxID=1403540 RepID=UPI0003ED85A4|nr:ethylbenzene dehydrogenase-related protein [Halomonas sp. BC04]EWH00049.1 cytochrome C [Halomonas sp. BC04]
MANNKMGHRVSPWLALALPAALALTWATQGSGVIENDHDRNIHIPDELIMPLQVQVAYNDDEVYFRYRWPAEQAYVYHDMLRYEDGVWHRHGASPVGPDLDNAYEDRVTMLVDDGSVPEFGRYGGYITVGSGMRYFPDVAGADEVRAHPHLGETLGRSDVRKYLPATRTDQNDWRSVVNEDLLSAQREAGYFLDLWHWRAGRSNPIGMADDNWVGEYRNSDAGRGAFTTNWDGENARPNWMFDPEAVDIHALRWEDVAANHYDFDGLYYLAEDFAIEFDPDHDWQNGDVIPRRLLRQPEGSRAAIRVHGDARWADGHWDVTLVRAMDTGSPLDDKTFREQGRYDIGIAVHRDATGSRWHYVSLPFSLGFGREADIQAQRLNGSEPDWSGDWTDITLLYPGQVNWPLLISDAHAGAKDIAEGTSVRARHNEKQLAYYGMEMEFNGPITARWGLTLFSGLFLMLGMTLALLPAFRPNHKGDL